MFELNPKELTGKFVPRYLVGSRMEVVNLQFEIAVRINNEIELRVASLLSR